MNEFLNDEELARLTGYQINQRKRIRYFLSAHNIPFVTNRKGDAVVKRADLHKQHNSVEETPNFAWLARA